MLSKNLIIVAIAAFMALACLAEEREDQQNVAKALRILQMLDDYYAQASRPRIDRRDVVASGDRAVDAAGDRVDPEILSRAVRLLWLDNLDRLYSYHTRPRYGKRSVSPSSWAKDVEKPDFPAWLAYARRR